MRSIPAFVLFAVGCGGTTLPGGETASFDAAAILEVAVAGGRVEVAAGGDTIDIEVLAGDANESWESTEEGDTLSLQAICGDGSPGCGVGFLISVPPGTHLDLVADNGELAVKGALEGDIAMKTTSGDVVGLDLGPAALDVLTNGTADVAFADRPRDVSLDGGAGDLTLTVPAGSYDVQFEGVGDTSLDSDIIDDDSSERLYLQAIGDMTILAAP